jgi:hypothetical protein
MSIQKFKDEINKSIESGVDVQKNKQHKTSLNQLVKNNLINEDNIDEIFKNEDRLKVMLDEYQAILMAANKKAVRTTKTRANNLASLYVSLFTFNSEGMTFQETLKAAILRKYDNVYDGVLKPKEYYAMKQKYKTYGEVAREIVAEGLEIDSKNENVDGYEPLFGTNTISGHVSLISRYIRGVGIPSVRIPIVRITFFEDFLSIPRGSLTNTLQVRRPAIKRQTSKRKKLEKVVDKLSPGLQIYFDEYSKFKTEASQPEIKLIPKLLVGKEEYLYVSESNGKKNSAWTYNPGNNKSSSVKAFYELLIAFMSFCVRDCGMNANEITLEHFTSIKLLDKWKSSLIKQGFGGMACMRALRQIKTSSGARGYLTLCGVLGDRSVEDYKEELSMINSLAMTWENLLEDKGLEKRDTKKHIRFLLDMDEKDKWDAVNSAIQWAFRHAKSLILYPLHDNIVQAFHSTQSLTILHLSRIHPLRNGNWTDLVLNKNQVDFNSNQPSITWYKEKKQYRMFVPIAFIKNRKRLDIIDIDVYYPESFSKMIDKLLEYRQLYIDVVLNENGKHKHNPKYFLLKQHYNPEKTDPNLEFKDESGTFGGRFKTQTAKGFNSVFPDLNIEGINGHAMRGLTASWWLNSHPGDFVGLAICLNDSLEVVMKDYAELNKKMAEQRISKAVQENLVNFDFEA